MRVFLKAVRSSLVGRNDIFFVPMPMPTGSRRSPPQQQCTEEREGCRCSC